MLYYEMSRVSAKVVRGRMGNRTLSEHNGLQYFADYSAGGFINLLYGWIRSGMQEEPEAYAEKVSEAVLKVIHDEKI